MVKRIAPGIGFLLAAWTALAGGGARADSPPNGVDFFEAKIRPVLAEHCYECHSAKAKKLRGGLRLDSRARLLAGGDRGPAVVPGDPDKSLLLEAVGYKNPDLQMPKDGKLPDAAIADLTAWVKMGAPWGKEDAAAAGPDKPAFDLQKRKQDHWAWRPIVRPEPPAVKDAAWPRGPVDRFILAKLEAKNLSPAPPADKRTLLRRVTFDLIGLPPTPAEIDAFLKGDASDAYEKVVDRLLASPQFGERWGRHWLDSGALRRDARPRIRLPDPRRLPVPRLRHPRPQCRPALRPVRNGAGRRRSARKAAPQPDRRVQRVDSRHGLLVPRRGGPFAGGREPGPGRPLRQPHRRFRQDVPRPDRGVRPLPRPQVRRDLHQGLLLSVWVHGELQLPTGAVRLAGTEPRRRSGAGRSA